MKRAKLCGLGALILGSLGALATPPTSHQPGSAPANGPVASGGQRWALKNATVHVGPDQVLENGVVYLDGGVIRSVEGGDDHNPAQDGWQVVDLQGQHVYAGFIEPFAQVDGPTLPENRAGGHWSPSVTPEKQALAGPGLSADERSRLRANGMAAAAISPKKGVLRGLGSVVATSDQPEDQSVPKPSVYADNSFLACAIESADGFRAYPTSHMGAVSLIRQALIDARWWREHEHRGPSYLEAVDPEHIPLWFDTSHELEGLLAGKIAREFALDQTRVVLVGNGTELRRLDALAAQANPVVVPLRYPVRPDVDSVAGLERTSLADLMLWEQAPTNARRLHDAGLTVALTTSKLPTGQSFWPNLRRAVHEGGLDPEDALAMLTTAPASILGVNDRLGTIEPGKVASLVVSDGPIFENDATILDVWVEGQRYQINNPKDDTLDGKWTIGIVGAPFTMELEFDGTRIKAREGDFENNAREVKIKLPHVSFLLDDEDDGTGTYVMTGTLIENRLVGTGISPDGSAFEWFADRDNTELVQSENIGDEAAENEKKNQLEAIPEDLGGTPFGPYALEQIPEQESVVFTHGTVWTQGPAGLIKDGYVWIDSGKIRDVGRMAALPEIDAGVRTINLRGQNVTPGLIDAHSHTGLFRFGVNEAGQAVTAECRIGDSLDPGHINFYRELAGGVTTANLLHGSANPIGGQNQIVKLRWGVSRPEDMFFEGAMPGIKFALGENVKQSNWGDRFTTRYPQTRMGVETLIRDRFEAARAYAQDHDRRDLELEALAQVLSGDRLIHCHSYRQDEILMLCRIAEEYGFKIGTFQHGLEVYKVAEVVKDHAIGASIFSDWWAYKVEVQDAIPYAGPLQTRVGVLTSYNSDSDELARRLNWEAAKAIKYSDGHLTEQQALAFVTINPAIQLGISERVGSIEAGKDADLAVWSGNPLSSLSRCVATWVDGREYFSIERDRILREQIKTQRERLIHKALQSPVPTKSDDSVDDEPDDQNAHILQLIEMLRNGDLGELDSCDLIDHEARLLKKIDN